MRCSPPVLEKRGIGASLPHRTQLGHFHKGLEGKTPDTGAAISCFFCSSRPFVLQAQVYFNIQTKGEQREWREVAVYRRHAREEGGAVPTKWGAGGVVTMLG